MNAFVALSYGDRRALVNTLRTLRRKPGRLALWSLYALVIVGFAFMRTAGFALARTTGGARHGTQPSFYVLAVSDMWVCGIAAAFGIALALGPTRWLGVFSCRAEALGLTGAHAPPLLVAAYLQLRAVATTLAQSFSRFAYVIVVAVPAASTLGALVAQLAFFAAGGAAIASIALPRALARGSVRIALIVAGAAIAAGAVLPLVVDALRVLKLAGVATPLQHVPVVHPGVVLLALAAGDLRPIALPLAVAAAATIAFALAARDAYPELYTISLANLDWRDRARMRRGGRRADTAAGGRTADVRSASATRLRGAFAFVWLDALMFSRRVTPAVAALVAGLALAAGAALGAFARGPNGDVVFVVLFGPLPGIYIALSSTTGVRLAPALRMPLFWLGGVPLAARLAAWTFGAFWRDAALAALAASGYVAIARDPRGAAVAFVGALGLLALTRAVGLAVFALLPNSVDQRGPAVMIRALVSFVLIAPAVAGGVIAALVLGSPFVAGTLGATAVAFTESAMLIAFAAWRLAGRVDRLAPA